MRRGFALCFLSECVEYVLETVVKLAGASFGVVFTLFACVNRMGGGRSIQHHNGVFFAICPNHAFAVCGGAGAYEPACVGATVKE